jgi:hypothetical protein
MHPPKPSGLDRSGCGRQGESVQFSRVRTFEQLARGKRSAWNSVRQRSFNRRFSESVGRRLRSRLATEFAIKNSGGNSVIEGPFR